MRSKRLQFLSTAIAIAIVSATICCPAGARKAKYKIGDTVADFALKDDKGNTVKLSQYRGMTVILNFYASW